MSEFYAEIRYLHVAAVIASGALFFVRGLALFAGFGWPLAGPARRLSHVVDTILLAAALMLTVVVGQYPFADAWLTAKVALLAVYVGLGVAAFWRGRTRAVRIACWLLALAVYGFIVSVARTHDPLGALGPFLR